MFFSRDPLNPLLFGRPLGLAALGTACLAVGLPWPGHFLLTVSAVLLAWLALQLIRHRGPDLVQGPNAAYVNWAPATLFLLSTTLPGRGQLVAWGFAAGVALGLAAVGVCRWWALAATRRAVDMAVVAWTIPLTVGSIVAPPSLQVPAGLLGAVSASASAAVLLLSTWRVVRRRGTHGMRSLWYGVGGSAVLADWAVHVVPAAWLPAALVAFGLTGVFWLGAVLHAGLRTHGAWSNLFSLCSTGKVLLALQLLIEAKALFALAGLALVLDLRATFGALRATRLLEDRSASGAFR